MVALGCPITLFALVSPGKTAAIQGFLEATSPTKAVMVFLRMTPVISRFYLLTKTVTIRTYCLLSLDWSDGMKGPVSLTMDPVVGTIWATTLMRLVTWPVSMAFGVSTSGLAGRGMMSLSGGASVGPGCVWSTLATVGEGIDLAGGASSLGGEGVVLCSLWASTELDPMPPTLIGVGWVTGHPWGVTGSLSTASRVNFSRFWKMSHL